jgi:osmotically-inducible protein OsmY
MTVFMDRNRDVETSVDIEEAARIRLQHSPYRAIRRVTCRFDDGVLTLAGSVPTFHYKQLAQTAVAQIVGVKSIVNDIFVDSSP